MTKVHNHPEAPILFCFPYSGASSSIYSRWAQHPALNMEIYPVELPGRGKRFSDPLVTDFKLLIRGLVNEISSQLIINSNRRYALFGHSLGSLIAYEVAHSLRELKFLSPLVLFVSGMSAPSTYDNLDYKTPKSDMQLAEDLKKYNGTPKEILDNQELMSIMFPILRADFLLCGSYVYRKQPPLSCPIVALAGISDTETSSDLPGWRDETIGTFELQMFQGDHFFVITKEAQVIEEINNRMAIAARAVTDRIESSVVSARTEL